MSIKFNPKELDDLLIACVNAFRIDQLFYAEDIPKQNLTSKDSLQILRMLDHINKYDNDLIIKYAQINDLPKYSVGSFTETFIIDKGGFQAIVKKEKEDEERRVAVEEATIKAGQASRAAAWAAWVSATGTLFSVAILCWQTYSNTNLENRLQKLEDRKPFKDTIVDKDTVRIKDSSKK
jgi:hypothetical protein